MARNPRNYKCPTRSLPIANDHGVDPGEHKKLVRAVRAETAANSFEATALEWLLWCAEHDHAT